MTADDLRAIEQEMQKAGDAVEDHCECGAAYSAHKYWDDKIYDVQGRDCPNQAWHREWRFSQGRTNQAKSDARVKVLETRLASLRGQYDARIAHLERALAVSADTEAAAWDAKTTAEAALEALRGSIPSEPQKSKI